MITGMVILFVLFSIYFFSSLAYSILLLFLLFRILFFEWPKLVNLNDKYIFFLSFFYPILPVFLLFYFNYNYRSIDILFPIYPLFLAFVSDSFAYVVGKLFGFHKIVPFISPKKSWEGLFGGFLGVFLFNLYFLPYLKLREFSMLQKKYLLIFLFSMFVCMAGFLGDIFISSLKRNRKIKDAGSILPGHGGFLDRFDSVFFIVFFITFFLLSFSF